MSAVVFWQTSGLVQAEQGLRLSVNHPPLGPGLNRGEPVLYRA